MAATRPHRFGLFLLLTVVAGVVVTAVSFVGCKRPDGEPPPPPPVTWENRWADGTVFYEIFVRSFADSDGDGVGDLRGIVERLDYLNDGDPDTDADLEVGGLWLMPIFESPSYHGYDTVDYDRVDSEYGTDEDLELLLREAHRRGIRVVVDLMINHTGVGHPWFLESAQGPDSPKRDWYVWREDDPGWTQPWGGSGPTWHERNGAYYHGLFWSGMPDLNFRNPEVRREIEAIADRWLARGLDGFRLDAARHLVETGPGDGQSDSPETLAYWSEFAAHVRRSHPGALLVGEVWSDTWTIGEYYGDASSIPGGDGLPMNFNFPLASAMISAVRESNPDAISAVLSDMADARPEGVLDGTFLTNHDMRRLASELSGDVSRMRSAAALLLTLPGSPFLYYGEEVGLENGPGDADEFKRTPMPWDVSPGVGFTTGEPWFAPAPGFETANVASQTGVKGSLLSTYRELIRLRNRNPALRVGAIEVLEGRSCGTSVLAFTRRDAASGEAAVVLHNLGDEDADCGPFPFAHVVPSLVFSTSPTRAPVAEAEGWSFRIPARGSAVWRVTGSRGIRGERDSGVTGR